MSAVLNAASERIKGRPRIFGQDSDAIRVRVRVKPARISQAFDGQTSFSNIFGVKIRSRVLGLRGDRRRCNGFLYRTSKSVALAVTTPCSG